MHVYKNSLFVCFFNESAGNMNSSSVVQGLFQFNKSEKERGGGCVCVWVFGGGGGGGEEKGEGERSVIYGIQLQRDLSIVQGDYG